MIDLRIELETKGQRIVSSLGEKRTREPNQKTRKITQGGSAIAWWQGAVDFPTCRGYYFVSTDSVC